MIGLGTDKILIEKLFWIFDDDGNGEVDHKELAVGLEMLKENTFEDKLDSKLDDWSLKISNMRYAYYENRVLRYL